MKIFALVALTLLLATSSAFTDEEVYATLDKVKKF